MPPTIVRGELTHRCRAGGQPPPSPPPALQTPLQDLDELIANFESSYVSSIDPLNSTNAMRLNPAEVEIDYVPAQPADRAGGDSWSRASTRQGTASNARMERIDEPGPGWAGSGPETPVTGRSSAPTTGREGGRSGSFFGGEGSLGRMIAAKLSGRRPGSSGTGSLAGSRPGTGGSQLGSARSFYTSDGSATERSGTESE